MDEYITSWSEVRLEVAKVNPKFSEIVDAINPGKKYRLYCVDYDYGAHILKEGKLYLPDRKTKKSFPLSSPMCSQQTREDLNYNDESNPVSLLLKNTAEIYIDLSDRIVPLHGLIFPGKLLSTWGVLSYGWSYAAAFSWNMTAGARSIFMAQKISDKQSHSNIQKLFNIKSHAPRSLLEHWNIFKELANHGSFGKPWKTKILLFSKAWFQNRDDPAWQNFYYFLYQTAWSGSEFWRNRFLWDLSFQIIQKDRNIKPCPYIASTTKHLLSVASGDVPGFILAKDNKA